MGLMSRVAIGLGLALCGAISVSEASADSFPENEYPKAIFGHLSGTLTWQDSSGGATTDARNSTIMKDFSDLTKVQTVPDFNADLTKFFATMQNGGAVPWSLIEFPTKGDFIRAKNAGLLEKLDPKVVPLNQMEEGSYDEYGINVMQYGINMAYNTAKYPNPASAPQKIEDLFDTQKFPGKRCFFKYPQFGATLESALLADGVDRDKLYPLDVDRALKKLDTIKDNIVWWSSGDEAIRLLTTGECDLGIAWSGRVYSAVKNDKAPLAMTWKDSLYSTAVYGIPKGAPNAAAAQALISMWIRDTKAQKALVSKITYTTPIKKLDQEGYSNDLAPWIVAGENAKAAILEDGDYYAANINAVVDKFNRWIAK